MIAKDVRVQTPDSGTICMLIMRPRNASGARLPTLLQFTIYADPIQNAVEARQSAAHGYAGVVGLTRGKGCSPDPPSVYQHDGQDAAAPIDWITKQPWSDGRVGMYGGSYSGFTPWAAAKYMPKGLEAIMVGAPVGPGIDVPMEGHVEWNFIYPWPFHTTDVKGLDDATYNDNARWNRLFREWYVSGRAYRDLDKIDGKPNPVFDEWISHPAYDAYWQSMIPYRREFARVNVPVLMTAGYFYGGTRHVGPFLRDGGLRFTLDVTRFGAQSSDRSWWRGEPGNRPLAKQLQVASVRPLRTSWDRQR